MAYTVCTRRSTVGKLPLFFVLTLVLIAHIQTILEA